MELCLRLEAAEQELLTACNEIMQKYELPCYLLEPIVNKLHRGVRDGKAAELAEAKQREECENASS